MKEEKKLSAIEFLVIVLTMISVWLIGSKNNWVWLFAIASNILWLYIGFKRKLLVIVITSFIYLLFNFRGAYMWIILKV